MGWLRQISRSVKKLSICYYFSVQSQIIERGRVVIGFEVGKDRDVRHHRPNLCFEVLGEIVRSLYGPRPRHQHVNADEAPRSCLPGSQRVPLDALLTVLI